MLESIGRMPVVERDATPLLPPAGADLGLVGMLTAIEEHTGQSRAQARVKVMHVLAERDAALPCTTGQSGEGVRDKRREC